MTKSVDGRGTRDEACPVLLRKEEGKRESLVAEDGKVHSRPPKREGGHAYGESRDGTKRIAVYTISRIKKKIPVDETIAIGSVISLVN